MAKDNDGILSFINFSKLSLITNKLKEKLGKCVKGVENRNAFDEEDEDDEDIVFFRSSSTR